jgi:hypothetical protein
LDKDYPKTKDTILFTGLHWVWHKRNLTLYKPGKWIITTKGEKYNIDFGDTESYKNNPNWFKDTLDKSQAYNKDSTISIRLVNMGNSTIEYVGCDTIKPIAKYKGPFPKAHVYNKFSGTNIGQGFDTLPNLYLCGQFLTKEERDSINIKLKHK